MTREEILALNPGPELDALVAEKVRKFVAWEEKRGEYLHVVFQKPGDQEPYKKYRNWEHHVSRFRRIPFSEINYHVHVVHGLPPSSTDLTAAWEVVEKLRELGYRPLLIPDWGKEWSVVIYRKAEYICDSGMVESAPHAICLAALLALEGGIESEHHREKTIREIRKAVSRGDLTPATAVWATRCSFLLSELDRARDILRETGQ